MSDLQTARPAPPPTEPGVRSSGSRQLRDFALVMLAGLVLLAAGTGGWLLAGAGRPPVPTGTSAEAGFARDMAVHHAQAVDLSWTVRDATTDPAVRFLAYDIASTQQAQIGMMSGWLSDWGLTASGSRPRMAWMGATSGSDAAPQGTGPTNGHGADHGDSAPDSPAGDPANSRAAAAAPGTQGHLLPDGRMPGMASTNELAAFRQLGGPAAEVEYLRLLVVHHRGGVDMAQAALELTDRPAVGALAGSIVASQRAEIDLLQGMLADRGAPPA